MQTSLLTRPSSLLPSVLEELLPSWLEINGKKGSALLTVPAVNIVEEKDHFAISLAAPGMKKEDFKIDVTDQELTVSAKTEVSSEEKGKKFTKREYNYSSFFRSFDLPDSVIASKISATYTDGVLHLSLPKKEEAKQQTASVQIEVK